METGMVKCEMARRQHVSSLLLFIFMQNRFDSKLSLLSGLIPRWNVHASISKFAVDKGLFCRDWWPARKVGGCVS